MGEERTPEVEAFWRAFFDATGTPDQRWDVVSFGDETMEDELAGLVVAGTKRATGMLLRDVEVVGYAMPAPGSLWVVTDASNTPRCVCRTTEVRVGPLSSVDAQFAWDEGEGDRTLEDWLDGHTRYFQRQAAREGFEFSPDIPMIFERFEVVWPPEIAD